MTPDEVFIRDWCKANSYVEENLFVKEMRQFMTDEQIARVLKLIDGVCPHCYNWSRKCQCSNDE
jgi:hypothetical protein